MAGIGRDALRLVPAPPGCEAVDVAQLADALRRLVGRSAVVVANVACAVELGDRREDCPDVGLAAPVGSTSCASRSQKTAHPADSSSRRCSHGLR
jgi:hypothetical protein